MQDDQHPTTDDPPYSGPVSPDETASNPGNESIHQPLEATDLATLYFGDCDDESSGQHYLFTFYPYGYIY